MVFNFEGGLNSVLKNHWKNIREADCSFGTRPTTFVIDDKIDSIKRESIRQIILKGSQLFA